MLIRYKRLTTTAKEPLIGTKYSAGCDLYADVDAPIIIPPHYTSKISTGLSIEIPIGYFGGIYARSGIATKRGLRPANAVGIIDSDFRGDITIALHNDSNSVQIVEVDERIAQLIIQPYLPIEFEESESLSTTERDCGGFGSTGR